MWSGFVNVLRNSFVSLASIFVMTMTLVIIGSLIFLNSLGGDFITYIKDKVDVNVYFDPAAEEPAILELKTELERLPEVAFVSYVSRDDVLIEFRARHQDDQEGYLRALDELGVNPFGAALSIKAKEPSEYEGIASFLEHRMTDAGGKPFIEDINYGRNKVVIEELESLTTNVGRFGLIIIAIFALASVLITFNTIRLAIYTSREEISVMRLVGASNLYIQGPFVVEGTLYGMASGLVALIAFFPLAWLFQGAVEEGMGANVLAYYLADFPVFLLVLLGAGALLGALSSYLAVRKYLSV
jgi:cell division transport system permease protein